MSCLFMLVSISNFRSGQVDDPTQRREVRRPNTFQGYPGRSLLISRLIPSSHIPFDPAS